MREGAELERVHARHRPRAHREYVAQDSTDAGRRALVRLDERRMVVAFDFEDRRPAVADVDRAGILARPLHHQLALRRQLSQVTTRRLVRAMLRPHHREYAQLGVSRGAADDLFDPAILVGRESVRAGLLDIDLRLTRKRNGTLAHRALPAIDSNILSPSTPPSIASTACSGCGIRPKTLKRSLATPAIARIEPLGFAASLSWPSAST